MKRTFKVFAILVLLLVAAAATVSASDSGSVRLGLEFGDPIAVLFLEVAPTVGFLPAIQAFPRWQGYFGFTILVPKFWK